MPSKRRVPTSKLPPQPLRYEDPETGDLIIGIVMALAIGTFFIAICAGLVAHWLR